MYVGTQDLHSPCFCWLTTLHSHWVGTLMFPPYWVGEISNSTRGIAFCPCILSGRKRPNIWPSSTFQLCNFLSLPSDLHMLSFSISPFFLLNSIYLTPLACPHLYCSSPLALLPPLSWNPIYVHGAICYLFMLAYCYVAHYLE